MDSTVSKSDIDPHLSILDEKEVYKKTDFIVSKKEPKAILNSVTSAPQLREKVTGKKVRVGEVKHYRESSRNSFTTGNDGLN